MKAMGPKGHLRFKAGFEQPLRGNIVDAPWIYIALVGLLLLVYARLLPKSGSTAGGAPLKREVEETIEQFAEDIEADNRKLVELISRMRKEHEEQLLRLKKRIEILERRIDDIKSATPASRPVLQTETFSDKQCLQDQDRDRIDEKETVPAMNIKERYEELFRLHELGKPVDYIAKKLGMNKGEVVLIIQLSKQEERLNA